MSTTLGQILARSPDVALFAKSYFRYVASLAERMDMSALAAFAAKLEDARHQGNTIFLIGNGGSAATASHMAQDLSLGLRSWGPEHVPLRAVSLTDNVSAMTASANDCGYDSIFVRQLAIQYRTGDLLVAISASGNSRNLIEAVRWVKQHGGHVTGMTGFDGGVLSNICDLMLHVASPIGEYGPVEDVHMMIDHMLYTWLYYEDRSSAITQRKYVEHARGLTSEASCSSVSVVLPAPSSSERSL